MNTLPKLGRRLAAGVLAQIALGLGSLSAEPVAVVRWDRLAWDGSAAERAAFDAAETWRRAAIAGVETDADGNLLVTVPRWLDARVPATLNRVVMVNGQPLLQPFPPQPEAHDPARTDALRSILGVRRDTAGRLWALDLGWVAGETGPTPDGAQKLVELDPRSGRIMRRIVFARGVAGDGSFLNDIAVDARREVAFVSDSGVRGAPDNPTGIIVVDLATGASRRVLDRHPSTANDRTRPLVASGEAVFPGNPLQVGINGIALSPDGETLYWGLTTGDGVFAAPTALIRDAGVPAERLAAAVRRVATPGGIDGLAVDDRGRLLIAGLTAGAVLRVDPASGATERLLDGASIVWPDSLARTASGELLVTVNHLNRVFGGTASFAPGSGTFAIYRLPGIAAGR